MVKTISRYICQQCGAESIKWQGQCSQCGEWNSLVETSVTKSLKNIAGTISKILNFSEIKPIALNRVKTGILELDRVLGGGMVTGSVVLVAGEPGIGKSTLLTQLALKLLRQKEKVLYICGEESPDQIKIRISRFSAAKDLDGLFFLSETNMENIITTLANNPQKYSSIIVDSVQTLWTERLTGSAGAVGQVRESSQMLLSLAKKTGIPVFLIGHVTKEGAIAGPKVLEHLVDTVLYLEGDREHDFRILRTNKNRFGPTDEVGIFRMTDKGMEEVLNPSEIFISKTLSPGAVVASVMSGIRPMLVEIQALVVPTTIAIPRRVAVGISYQKLQLLAAVLQKKLNLPLYQSDIFVNVVGGMTISEPAIDLAVCLAIASSFKNKILPPKSCVIGEVGLLGEIRKVSFMEKRIKEAKKLGYTNIIGSREIDLRQTLKYFQ